VRRRSVLTLAGPAALLGRTDKPVSDLRVRRSLTDLQQDYAEGTKKPLEDLMRAWKGIKELPASDPRSFLLLGGYHGEPFRGAGRAGNAYWDETSEDSRANGIPWALTAETFDLDGQAIPNPLRSYTFPVNVVDRISADPPDYSKPAGYETVRYPYSGLVGNPEDRAASARHNAQWTYPQAVTVLNANVVAWLNQKIAIRGKTVSTGVCQAYVDCLDAPNYTVFSNFTSAAHWNRNAPPVVSLESPHNKMHLAVGGFDAPGVRDESVISGANGDMGENDTAGLDPIFFFHHCFVDRLFWLWQKRHGATDDLPVIEGYPGTRAADSQAVMPGMPPGAGLAMDTPLEPFTLVSGGKSRSYTGRDGFNIERQLGYAYAGGSLDGPARAAVAQPAPASVNEPKVHFSGIDRASISGSFLITAFAGIDGERQPIGSEAVLSRWHVDGCANCQTHLLAGASFPLHGVNIDQLGDDAIGVEVRTHRGLLGGRPHGLTARTAEPQPRFRVELR
jgi:tyrosinase